VLLVSFNPGIQKQMAAKGASMSSQQILATCSVSVLCLSVGRAWSQEPRDVAAQRAAMKKLDSWIGEWKGTSWFQAGPGVKRESSVEESIRPRLGGLALLIEGQGRTKRDADKRDADKRDADKRDADKRDGGGDVLTHDALAIVGYDDETKRYRMMHFRAGDKMEESEIKLIEGGMQWERRTKKGTIRFTAKIDANRWHEVGEFSADGNTWHRFFEMTLQRQKAAAKPSP
jgi:hypothetical protein